MTKVIKSWASTYAIVGLTAFMSVSAWAADEKADAAPEKPTRSGEELAKACAACHGEDGVSISPDFPNIAGQYKSYLLYTLEGYRSGERNNAVMQSFVKDMSDQELENLAVFYASKSGLEPLPNDD